MTIMTDTVYIAQHKASMNQHTQSSMEFEHGAVRGQAAGVGENESRGGGGGGC